MKKVISTVLMISLLLALAAPAFSAYAATNYITVYVEGYGHALYKNNVKSEENKIYPLETDVMSKVSEALKPCLEKLALGIITDDYDAYCDEIYNSMAPIYDEIRLDKNGEVSDGSGWGGDMLTGRYSVNYNKGFSGGIITFQYDWRLSVEYNAEILEKFIERVCTEKGVQKVNLLGRCLGGNIVSSYLANAENLDRINKVIMYIPSTMGLSTIGAIFSGNIVLEGDSVEDAANNLLATNDMIEDPLTKEFILALVEMLNYASLLGLGLDTVSYIIDKVKDNLIPRLVRDTYGSFPSFWAMCPAEDVDEAVALCYGTDELKSEYAGMVEKILSYKQIQLNAYDTMKALSDKDVGFMVISKYNISNLPFSEDGKAQSDSMAETYRTSFGATTADFGTVLSDSYIKAMSDEEKHFLSADNKIDASTCLFPETTWFIKNLVHDNFPDAVDKLMNEFLVNDGYTVFSDENYPQFIEYTCDEETGSESLVPVTQLDADAESITKNEERFSVFFRFFTAIINFFTRIFSGSLNLDGLLGAAE